jgi:FlaA1/EpsC-like NDP-sugar epimerase
MTDVADPIPKNEGSFSRKQMDARRQLVDLARGPKRLILVLNDFLLLSLALWLALSLRLSVLYVPRSVDLAAILAAAPIIGVLTFIRFGLYRLVTRFISARGTLQILAAVAIATLCWTLMVFMAGQALTGVPRSVVVIYGVLAAFFVWASRQFAVLILKGLPNVTLASFKHERRPVAIYGAGTTGVQLLESLKRTRVYEPIGFIDENPSLWGQMVGGLKVYRPEKIGRMIERDNIKEVLLAMPEATHRHRQDVIKSLTQHPIIVKTLPAFEDIAEGRVRISDLRTLDVADLLGRDPVPPDVDLLRRSVTGKAVLVTGAGGSIGSEIARQVTKLRPRILVLLDISEPALFDIEQELAEQLAAHRENGETQATDVIAVLGSVLDPTLAHTTMERHGIQTIYHAAAYKHVPLVEANPIAGLVNNSFGTRTLADAARASGVERFVLISTDKAVRPTNVMGASKRLAELVLQAHACEAECATVFAMVRFGNVLDSSGSVVRRFRKQIEAGGPVTVTHPEVIRFFMSIPEAAELVLQAGAMSLGGEVFVLDMGEPVKIDQLARSMIRLMGREVLDIDQPDGDIAIEYIGLRPGEKLYEELLIGANTTATEHPRIAMCHEPHLTRAMLDKDLETLRTAMSQANVEAIHALLTKTVEGYSGQAQTGAKLVAEKGMLH